MNLGERDQALVDRYPGVDWKEPQVVTVLAESSAARPGELGDAEPTFVSRLTCRLCTALHGLKARDVSSGLVGWETVSEFQRHLETEHAA